MKTTLLVTALASLVVMSGCGSASRTPAQYSEDTGKAFAEHEAAMKTCYEGVLASKPDAKGDVTIGFQWTAINGADQRYLTKGVGLAVGGGSAENLKSEVTVEKTTAPEEVTKCVTDALANARLAPAGKGTGIGTWTFHFAPASAAAPAADAPKS